MKAKTLLTFLIMLLAFNLKAQSHISKGDYKCLLVPNSGNGLGGVSCPACQVTIKKYREVKEADDKRSADAAYAKAEADKKARELERKKEQVERDEKNKVTEVFVTKPSISSYSDNSSSNSNNPSETTQSSTTQTTSQIPSLESQYAKLGIPANTPTYTKQEVTNQLVTQAGSLVGELLNNWNANQERKEAEDHAKFIAGIREDRQKNQDKFDFVYLPLMDLAEKGDEDARMTLYFTSKIFQSEFRVPLREQWFQEAVEHNNIDALLMRSLFIFKEKDCTIMIKEIEKIANMGSVDAMMRLANLYDLRSDRGPKIGGNDPKKALEWYLKAAEKGSPNAMCYLGMIYKYGCTKPDGGYEKGWRVKYDDIHDEKIAFDWFTKSIQPDYIQSIFSKYEKHNILFYETSYFTPLSYSELANFYVKGKVVPKDISKAKDFELKRSEYTNTQKFEK